MRKTFVLMLMLLVASSAIAAPEIKTMGPYKVSFDLNTTLNYSLKVAPSVDIPESSMYSLQMITRNLTLGEITVTKYKNLTDSSLGTGKIIYRLDNMVRGFYYNVSTINMLIDGKKGFGVTGIEPKGWSLYQFHYWLDSKSCECGPVSVGTAEVAVRSLYPANVTSNIIASLHVEEIETKTSEKPKTLVFAPPESK